MDERSIRLLVVEDNEIDRLAFQRFVKNERLGYEYTDASSIAEGRAHLRTESFDAVLLDYSLGDGTAFDLINDIPDEIPTVIITGSGNEEIAVQAMKFGASDYLIKDPENNWLKTVPITVRNVIKAKGDELALREAHAELEFRVEERTAQLLDANRQLTQEIEQRKLVEEALRSSEERFRALTETTSEWIWEVDTHGSLTYASPRVTELLGYQPEELVGKSKLILMPRSEAKQMVPRFRGIMKSRKPFKNLESLNQHKDGRQVMLASSGVPFFDSQGVLLGYRGIDLDITERKRAEELLVQTERLKAVAELASGVAHNFNNLLQIVVSGLQLMLIRFEAGDHASIRSTVENILESSRQGAETIKWLQNFTQTEKSSLVEEGQVFNLSDTVTRAVEMSKPWWKSSPEKEGVQINLTESLDPKCLIKGMESAVFEVVVNLIKNSAESLPRGGDIEITTSVDEDSAVLSVRDNGIGIPKENLGKVFEPFFTTKGFDGTGMGLASAYGIVKRHGGEITVESEVGRGTEFVARMPLSKEALEVVTEVVADFPWQLRILLIDDEPLIVKMLELGLKKHDQTVITARSGHAGLEVFAQDPVDVVVSDLGMPVMNGWEVAKGVIEICESKGIPKPLFLLLTGWGETAARDERTSEFGIDTVVPKPVTVKQLLRIIGELMRKKS